MAFSVQNRELAKNILSSSLSKITDGKTYNITIEEVKQLKTRKQLKFFFGGIVKTLSAYLFDLGYGIDENTPYDSEMVKLIIYRKVGLYEKIETIDNEIIERPILTLSQMTIEQASKFITAVITWIDTKTDCILPPALRYCWLLDVDQDTIYRAKTSKFPNRDPSFLNYIRSQPCIYCGRIPRDGVRNEAHHCKNVFRDCPDIIPPDFSAIPLCTNCHTGSVRVQDMQPDKLEKRIPTFSYKLKLFLLLNYLRWREHRQ